MYVCKHFIEDNPQKSKRKYKVLVDIYYLFHTAKMCLQNSNNRITNIRSFITL